MFFLKIKFLSFSSKNIYEMSKILKIFRKKYKKIELLG